MSQTRHQNSLVDHCTHPYSYAYRDLFLRSSLSSTKSIPRFKLTSSAMVYEYNAFRAQLLDEGTHSPRSFRVEQQITRKDLLRRTCDRRPWMPYNSACAHRVHAFQRLRIGFA